MKNFKKVISMILTICVVLSCFSTMVFAAASSDIGTFLNEQYGLGDYGSWKLKNSGKGVISSTEVESGNYAATLGVSGDYLVRGDAEMLTVDVNGADGIAFETGKKIVIETRMKQSDPAARYYLKVNTNVLEAQEYNAYHTIFVNDKGTVTPADGVNASGMGNVYGAGITSTQLATNDWLDIKVELTGDGTAAPTGTITFTDVNNVSITKDVKVAVADGSSYVDALRTLEVRGRSSSTNQIYVDYLKVYTEKVTTKITGITAPEKIAPTDAIEVVFDAKILPSDLAEYVSVYDGATKLTGVTKSYDSETGTVSITSDNFVNTKTYTVKIDTEALYKANYSLETGVAAEYAVKVSKYLVDEDYGLDNYGSWKLKNSGVGAISSTEVESGNYAATLGVSGDYLVKANAEMLTMNVNGADGIAFETGKKIVIETRMKQTDTAARYYLKMNTNVLENQEYNAYFSLFSVDNGSIYTANGLYANGQGNVGDGISTSQIAVNDWITVKAELTGDGTVAPTGTITYTDVNGVSIKKPVKVAVADGSSYVDALRTLEVRGRSSSTNQIYVDYLRVYTEDIVDEVSNVAVSERVLPSQAIEVIFDATDLSKNYSKYVSLYDGTAEVTGVTKTYNEETGTVTLSAGKLTDGKTYTVKIDKDAIEADGIVARDAVLAEYSVLATSLVINDQFASGNVNGWFRLDESSSVIEAVAEGTSNYAMKFTENTSSNYAYAIKKLPGDGLAYETGKNIIIETRVKAPQTLTSIGYNVPLSGTISRGGNADQHRLMIFYDHGTSHQVRARGGNTDEWWGGESVRVNYTAGALLNKWIDVRITIVGNKESVIYEFKTEDETDWHIEEGTAASFFSKDGAVDYAGDRLTNVAVRSFAGNADVGAAPGANILVDYFRVSQVESKGQIKTLDFDGKKIDPKGNMYIWGSEADLAIIKDNVKLYNNAGQEIAVAVSVSGNKLTVNPNATLTAGKYTLKIDTTYGDVAGYMLNEREITVAVVDYTTYEQAFNGTADEWALKIPSQIAEETEATSGIVTEDGNSFLRLNISKHPADSGRGVGLSYNMGDNGFIFDSEGYTVVETKVRSNATARKLFKFNTNYSASTFGFNINTLFGIDWLADKIAHGHTRWNGNATAIQQGAPTEMADYFDNNWYTLRTVYNNKEGIATSYVFNQEGRLLSKDVTLLSEPYTMNPIDEAEEGEEETRYVGYWYNFADTTGTDREQLRYISELAWLLRYDEAIDLTEAETLDIDDVKIYNANSVDDPELAEEFLITSLVEVGGSAVEEFEAGREYVPTINVSTNASSVKFTLMGVLYKNDVVETVVVKDLDVASGVYTTDENIFIPNDNNVYKVKLFVWDSKSGMKPLCNTKEIFKVPGQ